MLQFYPIKQLVSIVSCKSVSFNELHQRSLRPIFACFLQLIVRLPPAGLCRFLSDLRPLLRRELRRSGRAALQTSPPAQRHRRRVFLPPRLWRRGLRLGRDGFRGRLPHGLVEDLVGPLVEIGRSLRSLWRAHGPIIACPNGQARRETFVEHFKLTHYRGGQGCRIPPPCPPAIGRGPRYPIVRPSGSAIRRSEASRRSNPAKSSDCAPSESARSGWGWTSISRPSAPAASAASAIGGT